MLIVDTGPDGVTSAFQVLSDDAVYEYRADRWWGEGPRLAFVGCNPSLITWQAGASLDPTSANCEAIAGRDGYAGVTMLNLWAVRGTDPRVLRDHPDPIGPGWAEAFDEAVRDVGFVVGAWGTAPSGAGARAARRRIAEVVDRIVALGLEVRCLGHTADGEPRHLSLRGVSRRPASTAAVRGSRKDAVAVPPRAAAAACRRATAGHARRSAIRRAGGSFNAVFARLRRA